MLKYGETGNNRFFSYEVQTYFTMATGQSHTIRFRTRDELWVYIGGTRVINWGGTSASIRDTTLNLDSLGYSEGVKYRESLETDWHRSDHMHCD